MTEAATPSPTTEKLTAPRGETREANIQPFWYKDAIIYEIHVRAFNDSNNDGIGDFPGLTQKLDYLQSLGVTALWLLPFYPSPMKDDGYDIADYYAINPIYGTLADFKTFIDEAHRRGLRVITELVLNHTSDQHPWFQRSRRAEPGSTWRDFYVWSDTPEKYKDARIIFKDFEPSNWTWDHTAHAYYWHRFYAHQPDLNYDNPAVHKAIFDVIDFWCDLGVDGFRLDAVAYLFEREGTSCENLPETHDFLKVLRQHIDQHYGDRLLLAEVNQWPEIAVPFFGAERGDECHMVFHFPLMPRLFMAVRMEDRVPILDIMQQTPPIPETSQWALFLRNHDELTLEMVTDEERDYMYRVYANDAKARINLGIRRRLAPLLSNDRKRIELLHLLLLSMPGTPVLYYGDEIGMGDNIFLGDRNGVRTPMHWSSDKNAGFSRASPQALYLPIILDPEYHYEAINVENQERNPNSLLWWMRQALTLRKRWCAFSRGSLEFLHPDNRRILAYVRRCEGERILVVANLSRTTQPVELDLSEFQGFNPVELFGQTRFPAITADPYFLTLSPHAAYWFSLEPAPISSTAPQIAPATWPLIQLATETWETILENRSREQLEAALPAWLKQRRWFAGVHKPIRSVTVEDAIPVPVAPESAFIGLGAEAARLRFPVPMAPETAFIGLLRVEYFEGDPEHYFLPLAYAQGEFAAQIEHTTPYLIIARLRLSSGQEGILFDAVASPSFTSTLLEGTGRHRTFRSSSGTLAGSTTHDYRRCRGEESAPLTPSLESEEQRNTGIFYGHQFFLKIFRRVEPGINPEVEVGRLLAEKEFPHVPPLTGFLEYKRPHGDGYSFGVLLGQIPDAISAWDMTLEMLSRYFGRLRALPEPGVIPNWNTDGQVRPALLDLAQQTPSEAVVQLMGAYLETARLLGRRTAELHQALASEPESPAFAPEPFNPYYQRSLFHSMRNRASHGLRLLRDRLPNLAAPVQTLARPLLSREADILKQLSAVAERPINGMRIRCHGDYNLRQVLSAGKDFVIIDLEGDPTQSLGQRKLKCSPFYDVARMIRSFHYAILAAFFKQVETGVLQPEDRPRFENAMQFWHVQASAAFLAGYIPNLHSEWLLPSSKEGLAVLLETLLLDRAMAELALELTHRPEWVSIPLHGIIELLDGTPAGPAQTNA